jgi:hypothetical protein
MIDYIFECIDEKGRRRQIVINATEREEAIAEFEYRYPKFKWYSTYHKSE